MSCLVKDYLAERCLKIRKTTFNLRSMKEDESELPPLPWEQPSAAGTETLNYIVGNLSDDPEPPPTIVPWTPGGESTQATLINFLFCFQNIANSYSKMLNVELDEDAAKFKEFLLISNNLGQYWNKMFDDGY